MNSSLSETAGHSIVNTSDAYTTKVPLPHHSKTSSQHKTQSLAWDHLKKIQ